MKTSQELQTCLPVIIDLLIQVTMKSQKFNLSPPAVLLHQTCLRDHFLHFFLQNNMIAS